jgi:hypothetical protein
MANRSRTEIVTQILEAVNDHGEDGSSEAPPNYPESILKEFGENENFVSLARDLIY